MRFFAVNMLQVYQFDTLVAWNMCVEIRQLFNKLTQFF